RIARCWRKLGDLSAAKAELDAIVTSWPYAEHAQYELALVLAEEGRAAEALEHLHVALAVWSEADPEFKWGRRALALQAELGGSVERQ
ncbi:MAG: hypothetical protein PVH40_08330, partial [Gemmatimonadales bacterium]